MSNQPRPMLTYFFSSREQPTVPAASTATDSTADDDSTATPKSTSRPSSSNDSATL